MTNYLIQNFSILRFGNLLIVFFSFFSGVTVHSFSRFTCTAIRSSSQSSKLFFFSSFVSLFYQHFLLFFSSIWLLDTQENRWLTKTYVWIWGVFSFKTFRAQDKRIKISKQKINKSGFEKWMSLQTDKKNTYSFMS